MTDDIKVPRFQVEFGGEIKESGDDLREIFAGLIRRPDYTYPSYLGPVDIAEIGSSEFRTDSGQLYIVMGIPDAAAPRFASGNVEAVFLQAQIDRVIKSVVIRANEALDGPSGTRVNFDNEVDACVQLARRFLPDYDYLYECFCEPHQESWARLERFVDKLNVLLDAAVYELPLPRKYTWPNGVVLFDADRFRYNRMTRDICRALGDDQKVENLRAQRANFLDQCLKYPGSQPGARSVKDDDAGLSPS